MVPIQTLESLEERVAAVETKLERLEKANPAQANPAQKFGASRGWQRMVGVFADNPLFEEAVRYGRKWRESKDLLDGEAAS